MPFNSEKQRKAFFARQGNVRSDVNPSIAGRISNFKEKMRQRRERKGFERIEKEKKELQREIQQAERLKQEATVERHRENIAQAKIQAQKELREIEKARKMRRIAPFISGAKKTISVGKKAFKAERKLEKSIRKVSRPRKSSRRRTIRYAPSKRKIRYAPRKRKAKRAESEEDVSPFGIDF